MGYTYMLARQLAYLKLPSMYWKSAALERVYSKLESCAGR